MKSAASHDGALGLRTCASANDCFRRHMYSNKAKFTTFLPSYRMATADLILVHCVIQAPAPSTQHQHPHSAPEPAICLHHMHSQLTAPAPAPPHQLHENSEIVRQGKTPFPDSVRSTTRVAVWDCLTTQVNERQALLRLAHGCKDEQASCRLAFVEMLIKRSYCKSRPSDTHSFLGPFR